MQSIDAALAAINALKPNEKLVYSQIAKNMVLTQERWAAATEVFLAPDKQLHKTSRQSTHNMKLSLSTILIDSLSEA